MTVIEGTGVTRGTVLRTVPIVLMRGGTSKGVFVLERDLPPAGPLRDQVLLDIMGSPDAMQIDGLGGTYSSTSKVVVVAPSTEDGIDVSYWFAQIGVDEPIVDWSGNCGNLTSAVAPYAIGTGLVPASEPETVLVLRNENTNVRIRATVQVSGGRVAVDGDQRIPGVPGTSAPVVTDYLDPGGGVLGAVLPTGSALDAITSGGRECHVSVLDVTHPTAFVAAADLGVRLADVPGPALNGDAPFLARAEELRGRCAVLLGRARQWEDARVASAIVPRLVLVDEPDALDADADLRAVALSMGAVHRALPMTAALALGAATFVDGTIPARLARGTAQHGVRIRTPKGVVRVIADVLGRPDGPVVRSVGVVRTARLLLSGDAWLRHPVRIRSQEVRRSDDGRQGL